MEPVAVPRGKGLLVDADVRAIIPASGGGGGSGGDMERMLTVMLILMVVMKLFIF